MSKTGRPQAVWSCSALALAALLNGTGCLRFGYSSVDNKSRATFDAGVDAGNGQNRPDASSQPDAQLTAAGGSGAVGGRAAGSGGSRANAGSGGTSIESVDAGERDAAVADASAPSDAGPVPAAGSGGGGTGGAGAGGMGGGGAGGGSGTSFANCTVNVAGVLFCNGFEDPEPWTGTLNAPWSYEKLTNGSYGPYTTSPYYGLVSGHFWTTGSNTSTSSRLAYRLQNGQSSGDLWLRYFYFLPSSVAINPYFSAGVMSSLNNPYPGFSLIIKPTSMTLETALSGVSTITPSATSTGFPKDRWVCVEHHVFIDPTNGYIEVFLDGTSILTSNKGNSVPSGGFSAAEVGIHYVANGQGPVDVYVDNVVVSTQRWGCN